MSDLTPEDRITAYAADRDVDLDEAMAAELADQFAAQDEVLETLTDLRDDPTVDRDYWEPDPETDELGAFLTRCDVQRSETGPLAGLTIGIKDNIAVGGMPMTCGSPVLEEFIPSDDATVVERLLDAGGRIVGKTNMDEFAFGGDESTLRFRLARNPRAPDHQPGSSSAGSGVAVTEGSVDVALGSDTGGSIRFPAAWCGVVGIKPTRGLVSHDGFVQYSKTLDNVGVLAREVEPAARTLSAMAGEDPRDERTHGVSAGAYGETAADTDLSALDELTIGIPEELDGNAPRLDEVTHAALDRLAAHGATLTEVSIPDYEYALPGWLAIGMTEMSNYFDARGLNYWALSDPRTELVAALDEALTSDPEELGSRTLAAWLYGQHLASAHGNQYYALAQTARRRVTEGVDTALADVDVLASTTVPLLPPEWGEGIDDVFAALSNTGIFNLTGHPAISVRAGSVDGLPTGLQFIGGHFEESAICQAAACWERLRNDEFD